MPQPLLVVVAGPTAVGKTGFCISIARHLGVPVVSADSRQLYREMRIGTARPLPEELAGVPHYFIGSHSVAQPLSAGQYEAEALPLLASLFQAHPVVVLAGGSGLYIDAVCRGFDPMPQVPETTQAALHHQYQQAGLPPLLQELEQKDPAFYQSVDHHNPARILRALEVIRATGQPFSSFRQAKAPERPFRILKICLYRPRETLYQRIDHRMDQMLAQGLEAEAQQLYPLRDRQPLQTVGYQEIFRHWQGHYDRQEMIRLLKRNSRRFAKRQLTWFRRDPAYHWVALADEESARAEVLRKIEQELLD